MILYPIFLPLLRTNFRDILVREEHTVCDLVVGYIFMQRVVKLYRTNKFTFDIYSIFSRNLPK